MQENISRLINSLFEVAISKDQKTKDLKSDDTPSACCKTFLLPDSMKIYFKCIAHLFDLCPQLKLFGLNTSRLRELVFNMCHFQLFSCVRQASVTFPQIFCVYFLQQLVR